MIPPAAAEKSGISYSDSTAMAQWPLGLPADRPLSGFTALDVGCGGGILAEPLAYLGTLKAQRASQALHPRNVR